MQIHDSTISLYAPANDTRPRLQPPTICTRVRAFSHKVRTGCLTWIRRKKCDEEKPTCRRCRDSRVKCDGYAQVLPQRKKEASRKQSPADQNAVQTTSAPIERVVGRSELLTMLSGIRLGVDFDGSADDKLYFHHFRTVTMVDFVRLATPRDFWSQRVLPLCHKEPAVRHAVVALGAAHRFFLQKLSKSPPGYTNTSLSHYEYVATRHYNKAIGELVQFNDITAPSPGNAQHTILTCCLLFVCLENILGRFDEGIRHMQAGARLFQTTNLSAVPHDSRQLMQDIATVLLRFNVDASIFTDDPVIPDMTPYAKPLIEIDEGPRPFLSLEEAKDAIWDLDVRMSHLDFDCPNGDGPASEDCCFDSSMMSELVAPFERWKTKFHLLVSSLANRQDLRIDIQREILALMLRRCTWDLWLRLEDKDENEELSKLCHELVEIAGRLYSIDASWSRRPMFTLDGDSIPALYFVATICEDTALVRRIIVLLRESRRREGLWDSWKMANDLEQELDSCGRIASIVGS